MPRHSAYNPDYESLYPRVEITPDVLHVFRTSDRKMRYMEHQLKTAVSYTHLTLPTIA